MKEFKGLKELVEMLERAEMEKKVSESEKKVVISIDEHATSECGCVGVELQNIEHGADLALAAAALLSTCMEKTVKGKEAETLTLIIFLATEVFAHSKTEQDAIDNSDESLKKLEALFGCLNSKDENTEE